jgi:hypothetical protein
MRKDAIACSHDDPAYPRPGEQFGHGLTKREATATAFLAAIIPGRPTNVARDEAAAEAVHYADALIFVLNEIEIGDANARNLLEEAADRGYEQCQYDQEKEEGKFYR